MTIREMVANQIKELGCDGLYHADMECGCILKDLFPCENPDLDECIPGYSQMRDDGDWIVGPKPEEKK